MNFETIFYLSGYAGKMRRILLFIFIVCIIFTSCKSNYQKTDVEEINPPEIIVSKQNKNLIFSYIDKDGKFKDTQNIDDIPEESRKQVIVFDISIPPQKRLSHKIIYIADLTNPDANGRYRYNIASRYEFESALREGIKPLPNDSAKTQNSKSIIIYTTSWCGVCAQLKKFLKSKGVSFIDKDIEKDESALNEMLSKVKSAGLRSAGVPVIDLYGEIIVGFNKDLLESKLK